MTATGTFAGRATELGRATDCITTTSGVYLVGRAGVGKTRLGEAVAAWAEARGYAVVRVRATAGSSELPFGVFLTQLLPSSTYNVRAEVKRLVAQALLT